MSITSKYNFKVSINQFHHPVESDFWDITEAVLIEIFENICLQLKERNKSLYTMIELGSNQSYYSLLFKHILGVDNTLNIMVEPYLKYFEASKGQFALNNCDGRFYHRCIGANWGNRKDVFDVPSITLHEILQEQNLNSIDVIQCDIDESELYMLESNLDFYKEHKTEFLFLGTHSIDLHSKCRDKLTNLGYTILLDHPTPDVGWDSLLVAQYISS